MEIFIFWIIGWVILSLGHYLYKLVYVKIVLSIANLMLWPFRKIHQFIMKIRNLLYLNYLKIKLFLIKIYKKI